jgi:hypothetical protein
MLHAGLDLSRKKIDICLPSPAGEIVAEWSRPDAGGLRGSPLGPACGARLGGA